MWSSTLLTVLLLGLTQVHHSVAQPVDAGNATEFIITHTASEYFPNAKGDLSYFNIDVRYVGYDDNTRSWLTALNPASGASDEEKAILLIEAAFAKPFDQNDPDMAEDVRLLLAAVAGETAALEPRAGSRFTLSGRHAVNWASCAGLFSCLSGTTCRFNLDIGRAPRSHCEARGGSNCCISWSTYQVRVGFFSTTWTTCNGEVAAEHQSKVSCQGHGSSAQGGDVCLSDRANGCT